MMTLAQWAIGGFIVVLIGALIACAIAWRAYGIAAPWAKIGMWAAAIWLLMATTPVWFWLLRLAIAAPLWTFGAPTQWLHLTPQASTAGPGAQQTPRPILAPDQIRFVLYEGPGGAQRNGWQVIPDQVVKPYQLPVGSGPETYTGINIAKFTGSLVQVEWPECSQFTPDQMEVRFSERGAWQYVAKQRSFRITEDDNVVHLRGRTTQNPGHPFNILVRVDPPVDGATRIRTEHLAGPAELLVWGPLPLELGQVSLRWELHVQFLSPTGELLPNKALAENPARIIIGSDPVDVHPCSSSIWSGTSSMVKQTGNLVIACPNLPGGTLVQVILLVRQ